MTQTTANQLDDRFGLKRAELLWNSLDFHWQHWIVRYGSENQSVLLSDLGIGSLIERVFWAVASMGLAMLLLAVWLLKSRHKPEDPALVLYRQFCKKMAKAGAVIGTGEGANDFAVRAKTQNPENGDLIDEITRIFVRLRYQQFPSQDDLKLLQKRIKFL